MLSALHPRKILLSISHPIFASDQCVTVESSRTYSETLVARKVPPVRIDFCVDFLRRERSIWAAWIVRCGAGIIVGSIRGARRWEVLAALIWQRSVAWRCEYSIVVTRASIVIGVPPRVVPRIETWIIPAIATRIVSRIEAWVVIVATVAGVVSRIEAWVVVVATVA